MSYTLQEVADRTGRNQAVLRKHIERGKLRTYKEDGRTMVEDADFDAYLASEELAATAAKVLHSDDVPREIGNMISRLPSRVAQAILEGMPTQKKPAGDPEQFRKATKDLPKNQPVVTGLVDDPHLGHPIGYAHQESPRWKRTSKSTWKLDGASWSWNGLEWEGGGSREGQTLGEGISPANPMSDLRPAVPPKVGAK